MKYKVRFYHDNLYEVIKHIENGIDYRQIFVEGEENIKVADNVQVFKGTLADCEAYIRLTEKGNL
jgi:hypothetical protein